VLSAALNLAVEYKHIAVSPKVKRLKVTGREVASLELQEAVKLLEAAEDEQDAVAFRVALLGGMRPAEICGLRWSDVDWENRRLHVRQQLVYLPDRGWHLADLKTDTKQGRQRWVGLDPGTLAALREHRTRQQKNRLAASTAYEDRDLVFARADGSFVTRKTLSWRFKQLAEQVGIAGVRGLHAARHTSAVLDLRAGTDIKVVSSRMGHSKVATTWDTYMKTPQDLEDEAAVRRAGLLGFGESEAGS
jgi:integrase